MTSVFYASVLLLMINFVITLSNFVADNVMTKFVKGGGGDGSGDDVGDGAGVGASGLKSSPNGLVSSNSSMA